MARMTRAGVAAAVMLATASVAACGSSDTPTGGGTAAAALQSATPNPTPTPTAPAGPPTAQLTAVGSYTLTTSTAANSIRCFDPSVNGPAITVFVATSGTGVSGRVTLRAGFVNVQLRSFSGGKAFERDFSGSGVTGFGTSTGAQLQSPLTETPGLFGYPKGTLGALSSISGMVSCGNEQPGGGSVTVAGQTESGTLGGPLGSIRVVCDLTGTVPSATILGLTAAGSSQALISVSVMGPAPYSVNLEEQVGSAFYEYTDIKNGGVVPAGDAAVSGTTVNLSATVTEDAAPTALPSPPHTLTVNGSATCGR